MSFLFLVIARVAIIVTCLLFVKGDTEAFGLIHRHPSGENFWHGMEGRHLH